MKSTHLLLLLSLTSTTTAFTPHTPSFITKHQHHNAAAAPLSMAGGEGGESEWNKALEESVTQAPGAFETEMKMKGLFGFKDTADPKITANSALLKWLEEEGEVYLSDASTWGEAPHPMAISVSTVDETTNESTGRGLLARRNVNEGDELLAIPMKLCITIDSARETFGDEIITNGMNEYLAIALQLIHERNLGEKSFYSSYLAVLPETAEVNPTFAWPDDDLEFLAGSPVVAATLSLQMKLKREYEDLVVNFAAARFPERFPLDKFSYENWVWAFTMLFSRAIRLRNLKAGEGLALVPYADLINHSPFSGAYVDAREVGWNGLFKQGDEEIILFAERGYRKMEQIYISYGPKSNADLLLLYGFALERNPYNSVDVTVSIKPRVATVDGDDDDVDPLAEEKIDFLARAGREDTVDFPCYADRYPTELLEYLRLMQMTPEDTRGKPLSAFDYSRTISAANEASVLTSIVQAVRYQLTKYENSEEDDAMLIQDKGMFRLFNYNQRMAIRHRRNEKRLLKRTVAALERQIKTRGLDREDLNRAGGSTLGTVLPGEVGRKGRTALEDRLEKMGLPVDLR